jgi:hypothetical protein
MTQTNSEYINNEKEKKLQMGLIDKIAFVIITVLFSLGLIGIVLDLVFS